MLGPSVFEERRSSQGRLVVLRIFVMVCFSALAVSFWVLQVIGNEKYRDQAASNHLRTIALRAPRGVFYDRHGKILVENRYAFSIAIIRERSTNIPGALKTLSGVTGVELTRLEETMRAHAKDPLFQPISVIDHATDVQVAAVMARRLELPEVVVQELPVRSYPSGSMAAHMVGYVNEISAPELKQAEYAGITPRTMIGKTGLEKIYNAKLMGRDGRKDVFVDSQNREVGEPINTEAPADGHRLQLTIDSDVQRALEDAFKVNELAGAAVLLDPRNGEILAMTSQPEYDPNDFADGIDPALWARLTSDPAKPLTNRLIQNRYPPGSTFKVLIAVAALSEKLITPETRFTCYGRKMFYGQEFHCDKKEGHGSLDFRQAMEKSCNVYFYEVGDLLGVDTIHAYAQKLGVIGRTGIDLPGEVESLVPSMAWKQKKYGEKWYSSETMSITIGQGYVDQTPLSLAVMMATVANGGTVVTPHVVKAIDEGQGWQTIGPPQPRSFSLIRPDVLGPLVDGLWMVVNNQGTALRAKIEGHDVVGKTGTAQVISEEGRRKAVAAGKTQNLTDNSWFVFYAPRNNPEVAGVVFVEHGGHGGVTAAPIARHVLDTYFAKQEGRVLPTWPGPTKVTTAPAPAAAAGTKPPAAAPVVSRGGGPGR